MDIISILLQREYNKQRFGNFLFETLKAYKNDCTLSNQNTSTIDRLQASAELGKYFGKYIRREF